MSHQDEKSPRRRSKDKRLYEQSNRGHSVIRLPFKESDYFEIVDDREVFREYVDEYIAKFPELFPESMRSGYELNDTRYSKRQKLYYRRVKVGERKYTIQPSFITPYWTANCEEVAYPLLLMNYGVPYWLITQHFGRQDDYWYRLFLHIGRFNIVSTTVRREGVVPEHLVADEKVSWWQGEEIYICTTAAEECLLGAQPSLTSDEQGLEEGYGVFKKEGARFSSIHYYNICAKNQ